MFRIGLKYIVPLGLVLVGGVGALQMGGLRTGAQQPTPGYLLTYPRREALVATVRATGQFEPARVAKLSFGTPGQVSEVLVAVGDQVAAGAPLARLDERELGLKVAQAQAALDQAMASYQKLAGGASAEELAAAVAQVQQARGQLVQVEGSVSAADLRAAEAQLAQAEARLREVEAGARPADLSAAEAQLQQAQIALESQRDQLSAAKTNAQTRMEVAANVLRDCQAEYSRIYWYNRRTEERGKLTQYLRDLEIKALHAVDNAELLLGQAEVAYDQARQAEVNGVEAATAQVRAASERLEHLRAGAGPGDLAAARAQVEMARAELADLRGRHRDGALQSAQAGIAQAEARLAQLQVGAQPDDLTIARAQMQSAEAALALARLAQENATLVAPFVGVVAEVNLSVGEMRGPAAGTAVVLADMSRLYVTVPVDEADVVRLAIGQPVTLSLEALPEVSLTGVIQALSPVARPGSGVTTYQARVATSESDPRVRVGMTANAAIVVSEKRDALLIPRRAVYSVGQRRVVDVAADPSLCNASPEEYPHDLERVQREVQTGLASDRMIEIMSGLDEGSCVYVMGVDARANPLPPVVAGP